MRNGIVPVISVGDIHYWPLRNSSVEFKDLLTLVDPVHRGNSGVVLYPVIGSCSLTGRRQGTIMCIHGHTYKVHKHTHMRSYIKIHIPVFIDLLTLEDPIHKGNSGGILYMVIGSCPSLEEADERGTIMWWTSQKRRERQHKGGGGKEP